jgi:acyl carrier protein
MHATTMMQSEKARPTREELLGLFRDTASEVVERDFRYIVESMRIDELVIDSLGMLEILGSMERRLHIQLPDESLTDLRTVRDLLDVVEKRLA